MKTVIKIDDFGITKLLGWAATSRKLWEQRAKLKAARTPLANREMLFKRTGPLHRGVLICSALLALQGCKSQADEPAILEQNAERVSLVLYRSDGDFDWKTVGEWILIDSGEQLQVRRNRIRPDSKFIVQEWDEKNLKIEQSKQMGKTPLKLDRKNGIVCNETRCATLYAICPTQLEMKYGKKCVTFSHS